MTLPTFAPTVAPGPEPRFSPQVKIREASFGDGYSQASPDGLNHIRQSVELTWSGLTLTQARDLKNFFEARKGVDPFWYQPWTLGSAKKWTCKDWSFSGTAPHTFRAKLVESFTLEE